MRARWMTLGLVIGVVLTLGIGAAVASGTSLPRSGSVVKAATSNASDWWAAMDAMHDSPGMQQMHSHMPAGLQQQCDKLHDQMGQWAQQHPDLGQGGMMGGSSHSGSGHDGMMGSGSGMMGT
jgi:hypothetical protein